MVCDRGRTSYTHDFGFDNHNDEWNASSDLEGIVVNR